MNAFALATWLLAPALVPLALAETPPPAPQEAPSLPLADALREQLDIIEKNNGEDFYEAARVVLARSLDPTEFYKLMEEASRAGSAAATCWVTCMDMNRLEGAGASLADDPRAMELSARVEAAMSKGYVPAFMLAASMAHNGFGRAKDADAATRYMIEGSKRGCQRARAVFLAQSGRLAKGEKEPAVAAELARRNHRLEDMIAQAYGDTEEGVRWLRRATEHGSALAPYLLTQSRAAALPEAESMKMLELAASRHHETAMAFLGTLKLKAKMLNATAGTSLAEDREGGWELLRMAAVLGHPEAQRTLAFAMGKGEVDFPVSATGICNLFRMAAEQGDVPGMAGYGYCLLVGRGCAMDPVRGKELLRRAAEKGEPGVPQLVASVYFNGIGVKPDLRRAVNALGEDAAMGQPESYAIMAALTALGNEGTPPDAFRARVYLDMAKAECGGKAQALYDEILAGKGWRALPMLWSAAASE